MIGTVVVRDGARVRPVIGQPFDFTKEEIDGITEAAPNALQMPSKEATEDQATAASSTTSVTGKAGVKPSAEASQAKAKDGQKKATASKSDEEASQDEDL